MCCRATIRRPLRSKRAMISPVRPRANASGLTRMRVRSMGGCVLLGGLLRGRLVRGGGLEGGSRLGRELLVGGRSPPPAAGRRRDAGDLGLAVRADAPVGIERLATARARVLELAQTARAAQEVLLDFRVAMRAEEVVQRMQSRLGG